MKLHETEKFWFDSQLEKKNYSLTQSFQKICGPPPILLIKGYFLGEAKRPGREADHIPLSSAEVKNEWSYASTASLCLRGVQKDNFIFFLLCGT